MDSQLLQTPAEVKDWLDRHGVSITSWAKANGFDPDVIFSLLNGRTRGRRGMAYQAALALGLRARPRDGELPPITKPASPHQGLKHQKRRSDNNGRLNKY